MKLLLFLFPLCSAQYVPQPTRSIDLWHPLGAPSTARPKNKEIGNDEVIVRLSIGDILGKSVVLPNLPWTADRDPSEQVPSDRIPMEPNPLPRKNNVTVYTFLGVPYAEPPVSQRRFKPPQQLKHFPGTAPYLAFRYGASCAQDVEQSPQPIVNNPYPLDVSEDCLYLNVFTPDVSKVSGRSYPVAVFLHGGNFQTGSASEWPGHGLASRGVVVVTVNYRLGAFGFMSLGDRESGNYGLQDQRLALEWVRDHIASFGGDPQAVTLVGHDAGGASVGLHMLSPYSKHLFRAASSMSGAEVSYHSTIGKPALAFNNTMKLGRYLGCTQAVAHHVWDCIMTRSTDDIIRATETIPIEYNRYLFLPTVDGRIVPGHPYWILNNAPTGASSVMSPVPLLVGMNAQDGSEVILEDRYLGEFNDFNNVDQQYMRSFALEYSFRHNYSMNREAITQAMVDRYTYWPDPSDSWSVRAGFIDLATDAFYTAPISLSAHLHSSSGSRTFMYVNNYNFSRGNEDFRFLEGWRGVCHDCDLYLLFGYPFMPPDLRPSSLKNVSFTEVDRNASQLFSNCYRRFFHYEDPNFLHDGTWTAYQPRRHWYLNFNYTQYSGMDSPGRISRDYRYSDVAFWNEYIPALVNYMTTTFPPSVVSERRQLVVAFWILGLVVIFLMLFIVLTAAFSYKLFALPVQSNPKDTNHLVEYTDSYMSDNSLPQHNSRVSVL